MNEESRYTLEEAVKLLPCPFCGGEAVYDRGTEADYGYDRCVCLVCDAQTCWTEWDKPAKIKEWNTRASAAPPLVCGACGDIWQEGMSCGQKDNGHPFQTCYPVASAAPSDGRSDSGKNHLSAIRRRLKQLYDASPVDACRLREQLSGEIDWIDSQMGTSTHPSAEREGGNG